MKIIILTVKFISRFYWCIGHCLKEGVLFGEVCPEFLAKKASISSFANSSRGNTACRTISRTKGDLMPELTKTFFEKILRDSERQELQVGDLIIFVDFSVPCSGLIFYFLLYLFGG